MCNRGSGRQAALLKKGGSNSRPGGRVLTAGLKDGLVHSAAPSSFHDPQVDVRAIRTLMHGINNEWVSIMHRAHPGRDVE